MKAIWLTASAMLLFAVLMATPSFADPAIVIHKDSGLCGMPGSDANGDITFGGIGNIWLDVTNNNKVQLTCKGTGMTNDSGKGQHYTGFVCGLVDGNGNGYVTTDSEATVSASGNSSLKCTVTLP